MQTTFANIGWTVGNHCNARCGHCYSWQVRKDSDEFLTESDVDQVISQLVRLGVETVNLGGNEPIYTHGPALRDTLLPYIIETLATNNIPVGLTTNGVSFWYLNKFHPDTLALVNDIDFSLDSPDKGEHDLNRGVALYDFVIEQIQTCRSLDIDCSIISCGMRATFTPAVLDDFLSICAALDCEFRINTLKPVEPTLIAQMPTRSQFYDGFAFLMQNSECITLGESCITAFTQSGDAGCPCGTTSFRINAKDAEGRISLNPCVYGHDFKTGDLLSDDILEIVVGTEFERFSRRRSELPRACRESGCDYLETCRGGCTARSYLVHGTLDERDPYCPQQHIDEVGLRPGLPERPHVGLSDGIRVHDHYLCTWIGKPTVSPRLRLDGPAPTAGAEPPFLDEPSLPISGHEQAPRPTSAAPGSHASLVPVALTRKSQIRPLTSQIDE
jgi:radical SAM protein with 4Fe4S-binding SPASM domain